MSAEPGRPRLTAVPGQPRLDVDGAGLRTVMAHFTTGVTVVTAGGERGHGMTANAFSSVSLDPPMVLCCVARTARLHAAVLAADAFAVSILSAEQGDIARYFADRRRPDGMAQFDAVDVQWGARTGSPLLTGALAWMECRLAEVYEGGDHSIFLGEVLACGRGTGSGALSFYDGDYHQIDPVTGRPTDRTKEAS